VRRVVVPGAGEGPTANGRFAYFTTTAPGVKDGESAGGVAASGVSVQPALAEKCLGAGCAPRSLAVVRVDVR